MFSIARMEKECPNCKATMSADAASRPGFACYDCTKCALVVIEVVKEPLPPKPAPTSTTRGEMLRSALSLALIKAVKMVRGLRQGLTNEERNAVADDVVRLLRKERNDIWKL